ncbi:MAG: alpha/beta hydrolase [Rhodobacterales bacterium]|nr:alpha/beta hydrolase [Rhodobacterales bacterium]
MELDDAYSNAAYIPDAMTYPPKWQKSAAKFRAAHAASTLDIPYGTGPRHKLDLFHSNAPARGLVVFVHGGYWLNFDKSDWSHLAAGALGRGWSVAMPSYDLCPAATISEITQQIAASISVAAALEDGPICLAGHSAGGHLVARMLDKAVLPADIGARLQKVVPISPVADLRPLLRTTMNEDLRLTMEEASAESPVLMKDRYDAAVTVWVGGDERPVFLDQAQWLATAWGVERALAKDRHHFNVIEDLADENSDLVNTLLGA